MVLLWDYKKKKKKPRGKGMQSMGETAEEAGRTCSLGVLLTAG